jgi:hypothetical protein
LILLDLVETLNQRVEGSSPSTPTNEINNLIEKILKPKNPSCAHGAHASGYFGREHAQA